VALTAGYIAPDLGVAVAQTQWQSIATTGIFVLSGLALKRKDAVSALRSTSGWPSLL
jgi:hypothetical protein